MALDAADVILVHSYLTDLVTFFDLSATTMTRIKANFIWAIGYNVLALPVASGLLFPLLKHQLPPVFAGIAMICSSLSVLGSSLALRCFKPMTHILGDAPERSDGRKQSNGPWIDVEMEEMDEPLMVDRETH